MLSTTPDKSSHLPTMGIPQQQSRKFMKPPTNCWNFILEAPIRNQFHLCRAIQSREKENYCLTLEKQHGFCLDRRLNVQHRCQGCLHKLDCNPKAKTIQQRMKRTVLIRRENFNEEIVRLLLVNFIKQVDYPKQASHIVARSNNSKIRLCIDFTNQNKAGPMYPYPLPYTTDLVDATFGYQRLPFLDAF